MKIRLGKPALNTGGKNEKPRRGVLKGKTMSINSPVQITDFCHPQITITFDLF